MPFSSSLRVTLKARLGGLTVDVWPVPISHRPARSKDLTVSHGQSAANTVLRRNESRWSTERDPLRYSIRADPPSQERSQQE